GEAFEQGRTALMLHGIPEENTPTLLVRPGVDALRVLLVNRRPINPLLPPIAYEILRAAVAGNSPVTLARYDGGVAVMTGDRQFDCNFDLEQAALLRRAVSMLVQVGWLEETGGGGYYVTHAGYSAAHRLADDAQPRFLKVKEQMPELIAEMK